MKAVRVLLVLTLLLAQPLGTPASPESVEDAIPEIDVGSFLVEDLGLHLSAPHPGVAVRDCDALAVLVHVSWRVEDRSAPLRAGVRSAAFSLAAYEDDRLVAADVEEVAWSTVPWERASATTDVPQLVLQVDEGRGALRLELVGRFWDGPMSGEPDEEKRAVVEVETGCNPHLDAMAESVAEGARRRAWREVGCAGQPLAAGEENAEAGGMAPSDDQATPTSEAPIDLVPAPSDVEGDPASTAAALLGLAGVKAESRPSGTQAPPEVTIQTTVRNLAEVPLNVTVTWTVEGPDASFHASPQVCVLPRSGLVLSADLGQPDAGDYLITAQLQAQTDASGPLVSILLNATYHQPRGLDGNVSDYAFVLAPNGTMSPVLPGQVVADESDHVRVTLPSGSQLLVYERWLDSHGHVYGSPAPFSVVDLTSADGFVGALPPGGIRGRYVLLGDATLLSGTQDALVPIRFGHSDLYTLGSPGMLHLQERPMKIAFEKAPGTTHLPEPNQTRVVTEGDQVMTIDLTDPASVLGQKLVFDRAWLRSLGFQSPLFLQDGVPIPATPTPEGYAVEPPHFSRIQVTQEFGADDGSWERYVLMADENDKAMKSFEIPPDVRLGAQTAKLRVLAQAVTCGGYANAGASHALVINGQTAANFNPCRWQEASATRWREFNVPVGRLVAGGNTFEIREISTGQRGNRNLWLMVDADTNEGRTTTWSYDPRNPGSLPESCTQHGSGGAPVECVDGELMWRLAVTHSLRHPKLDVKTTITDNHNGASFTFLVDLSASSGGTISQYAYDMDDNGAFETTTSSSSPLSHPYPDARPHCFRVRVTNETGATTARHCMFKALWGQPDETPRTQFVRAYASRNVEIYLDHTVTPHDAQWLYKYADAVLTHVAVTYGHFPADRKPFHVFGHKDPHAPQAYKRTPPFFALWDGPPLALTSLNMPNWAPTDGWDVGQDTAREVFLHETAHYVEALAEGSPPRGVRHKYSPGYDLVWGDSRWAAWVIVQAHKSIPGHSHDLARMRASFTAECSGIRSNTLWLTGQRTHGQTVLTGFASTAGIAPGMDVRGVGILNEAKVVAKTATTVTMDLAAIGTGTHNVGFHSPVAGGWVPLPAGNPDASNDCWFRDWWTPIEATYGGSQTVARFFSLATRNVLPTGTTASPPEFSMFCNAPNCRKPLNMGEFLLFMSAASGKNLKGLAASAFLRGEGAGGSVGSWPARWDAEWSAARAAYPTVAAMYQDCEGTGAIKVRAYRDVGKGGGCVAYDRDQRNFQNQFFTGGDPVDLAISSLVVQPGYAVVLFSQPDYRGDVVTLRGDNPPLPAGWNDRARSLRVVQDCASGNGAATFYQHANYAGGCMGIPASAEGVDLRSLAGVVLDNGASANAALSSFRLAAGYNVALYTGDHFGGTRTAYTSQQASLGAMNDQARSLRVMPKCTTVAGPVRVHELPNHGGGCRTLTEDLESLEGAVLDNGAGMQGSFASFTVVNGHNLVLYAEPWHAGERQAWRGSQNVADAGAWRAKAASFEVRPACDATAKVVLYEDADHALSTDKGCFGANEGIADFTHLKMDNGLGLNDQVSSFKVAAGCTVTFYEHAWYQGRSFARSANTPRLPAADNDAFSSMQLSDC